MHSALPAEGTKTNPECRDSSDPDRSAGDARGLHALGHRFPDLFAKSLIPLHVSDHVRIRSVLVFAQRNPDWNRAGDRNRRVAGAPGSSGGKNARDGFGTPVGSLTPGSTSNA